MGIAKAKSHGALNEHNANSININQNKELVILVRDLNSALPIEDYKDVVAGIRGYYHNGEYCSRVQYYYQGDDVDEAYEINNECARIGKMVQTLGRLMSSTGGEECNYWSQTKNFYYWVRFNPKFAEHDYCVHIKAYRKE